MKIRNKRDYRDKETGAIQKKGAVREVKDKRGREIIAKGCAEEVKDPGAAAPAAE